MSHGLDHRLERLAAYFLACTCRADVDPATIDRDLLPQIFILQIERPQPPAPPRLQVRLTGTALDAAFGRTTRGMWLEDFIHGPRGVEVMAQFHACAETHQAAWMRQVTRLPQRPPRMVEAVTIWLDPGYLYGGIIFQEYTGTLGREPVFQSGALR